MHAHPVGRPPYARAALPQAKQAKVRKLVEQEVGHRKSWASHTTSAAGLGETKPGDVLGWSLPSCETGRIGCMLSRARAGANCRHLPHYHCGAPLQHVSLGARAPLIAPHPSICTAFYPQTTAAAARTQQQQRPVAVAPAPKAGGGSAAGSGGLPSDFFDSKPGAKAVS